eukprot:6804024-Heterocapsa_arctica.AAC.1
MMFADHAVNIPKRVYIDGSATKLGASSYAGWGMWAPDNPILKENEPLQGRDQGSDRAEVSFGSSTGKDHKQH